MKLEVLLSCMNEENFSIIDRINLDSDILIVNQCHENSYLEEIRNGYNCRMIKTTKRGLSHSRNELLNNMNGDIGIFCDDDVIYFDNYKEIIEKAFNELKDADIVVFNTEMLNYKGPTRKPITIIREAPKNKNYGSVRIAFKKESLYKKNMWFHINFGSGSRYSSGEDSLLLREARKKNMKVYEYPMTIARVSYEKSTWFDGYNEKYFYDKGAWVRAAYPKLYIFFKWYFLKFYKNSPLSIFEILKYINQGIKGYHLNLGYKEYNERTR